MTKATVSAPSNIAFVKYWGARDLEAVVPANPSISMTLSVCRSITTAERTDRYEDVIEVVDTDGRAAPASDRFRTGAIRHLDRLRVALGVDARFRIATHNTFPSDAGIASSASGFTALAFAVATAVGADPSPSELSELARASGSGSASRSAWGGYVAWPGPDGDRAAPIASADHWHLVDLVTIVADGPKPADSRAGHRRAATSPHFERRLELLPERLATVEAAIADRDLQRLGPVLEEEAIELHAIAMTSRPPIFYWQPATLTVLDAVRRLRDEGHSAWCTLDAGANVHVLTEPATADAVRRRLETTPGVLRVIADETGSGPRIEDTPLV